MKSKSLAQLLLFVLTVAFWLKIAWPLMTKEALAIGAIGGLTIHWAFTNKGSRAVALIEPGTSGWRVMLYDMMLVSFLVALAQHADNNFSTLLDALWPLNEKTAVLASTLSGILIDYSIGG